MTEKHYARFKHHEPNLVRELVEVFPFAAIMTNGPSAPLVAQAPMTYRDSHTNAGALEFHLARANPICRFLEAKPPITVLVQGPSAPVSRS